MSCDKGAFGLAHAPLFSWRRSKICISCVNLACVFMCLVTRECLGLLMHLSFHEGICLSLVCKPFLCVCVSFDKGTFVLPMHLSFHKGIQTFVRCVLAFLSFTCPCGVGWIKTGPCTSPFHKRIQTFLSCASTFYSCVLLSMCLMIVLDLPASYTSSLNKGIPLRLIYW